MATRPPRLKRPNTFFHVTSRGTNKWNIFLDDQDRTRFMVLLASVCKRYGVEVHAYCLMGNHFHLVLFCPDPVLSSAMRDLKSRYAKYYNQRHKGTGGVFEAPFVAVPILDDEHLMTEIRYVHRNPLDLDPRVCLALCVWSSHGIYLGIRPEPAFIHTRIGHKLFGPNYRLAIEEPRPTDKVQNVVRPALATSLATSTVTSPGDVTLPPAEEWSLAGVLAEVARAARVPVLEVHPERRNGLVGIAILIATDILGQAAAEIAEPFGYKSAGAVRMAAKRTRARMMSNESIQAIHSAVAQRMRSTDRPRT